MPATLKLASTDDRVVLELQHDVRGFVRLSLRGEVVLVECRWPFDVEAGDWIEIRNEIPTRDYEAALAAFADTGTGHAGGQEHGFVELVELDEKTTQLELEDEASYAPTRLSLRIAMGRDSLAKTLGDTFAHARAAAQDD